MMRIAVLGAGQMGSGIAQVCAAAGYPVVLRDLDPAALDRARAVIAASLDRMLAKARITEADKDATLARIATVTTAAALADADLVIEAVTENLEVKRAIFRELSATCRPDAILASNTSSISLTRLAAAVEHPGRVIGMHFMNPVPMMQLVEVISARQTSPGTRDTVEALARALGKVPVDVKNSPGFIANRVLIPMINEAAFCLSEGLATAEEIDTVMKLGMGHPMGPLALADLIGIDTVLAIMQVLLDGFNDSKYRPCPLLVEMVDAGHLGRKSGRGFFAYPGR
ncbi:MAG: 3-hydroxybutyryl-CoA dehydrogenase [bacterium]|jgi:3-hydroxybutyryl-CoA dehydrogenase|nr:3-hydroxybutyryl-CoA dehydrogenase [Betaproteobacteria bacterium]